MGRGSWYRRLGVWMVGTGAQTPPVSCFLGWAWFPWAPCLSKKGLEGWSWGSFQAGPLGGQPSPPICMLTKSLQLHSTLCDHMTTALSTGFSRQEYWSGFPALLQGVFLIQGRNSCLLCLLHWQGGSLPRVPPGKPLLPSDGDQSRGQEWSCSVLLRQAFAAAGARVAPKGT